jgi:hypothetical protein
MRRVISQQLKPDHIIVSYDDGTSEEHPYFVDADGNEYADLDPNNEIFVPTYQPRGEG